MAVRPWLHVKLEGARECTSPTSEFLQTPLFEKSVALTVLELLAFNAQKFRSHMTLATLTFRKFLRGNMPVKFEVRSFNCFKLV